MTATVEVAFGVAPFNSTALDADQGTNWTDVTSYVRSLNYTTSSRSERFGVFSAGSATVVLNALDREMDPSFSGSTYVGQFLRDVPIRIIGTHNSTEYVQWSGYVREWTPRYVGKDAVTEIRATDALGLVARHSLTPLVDADGEALPSYARDQTGERIGRVLDLVGFPSSYRDIDTGRQLVSTTFGSNALQHCQLVALSDNGMFYAQRDGTLTFDAPTSLTDTRQLTSQQTLTSMVINPPPTRAGVGEGFTNLVRIGGSGVTTQETNNVGTNQTSVVLQRTDLLMLHNAQAKAIANFYSDLYATEKPYTSGVSFVAESPAAANTTSIFVRKLRDRVTVNMTPPGGGASFSDQVFVDGISGTIGTDQVWRITWKLSSADAYDDNLDAAPADWFILNDGTKGELNSGYKLGY